MAASAGFIGAGTTIGYATAVGGAYTLVVEAFDAKAPKTVTDKVEFTHYTSQSTTKEYKPGWKDGGDNGSFEANYTEAGAVALIAVEGLQKYWKITYNGGSYHTWFGTLNNVEISAPNQDRITIKGEVSLDSGPSDGVLAFTSA